MFSPLIAIINESTAVTDDEVAAYAAAQLKAVHTDFAPIWGRSARIKVYPRTKAPPANAWQLGIFDNSDQAGALGYHDATPTGLPLGKAFAGTDKQYGMDWRVTASHELWEMLGDPDISVCAQLDAQTFIAYELADAVEADEFAYDVDGIKISDFVYPAYFESYNDTGPFDHSRALSRPLSMAAGGYMNVWTPAGGWGQRFAEAGEDLRAMVQTGLGVGPPSDRYSARPNLGSRRERRRTPRPHWLTSTTEVDREEPEEAA